MDVKSIYESIRKYGRDVTVLYQNKNYSGKCFVEPLRYKNKMYLGDTYLPVGCFDGGHYLYIGEKELRIDTMDESAKLLMNNSVYCIKRAELYTAGDIDLYIWAIICKVSEASEENKGGV